MCKLFSEISLSFFPDGAAKAPRKASVDKTTARNAPTRKSVMARIETLEARLLEEEDKRLKVAVEMHKEIVQVIDRGVSAFERYVNLLERQEQKNV